MPTEPHNIDLLRFIADGMLIVESMPLHPDTDHMDDMAMYDEAESFYSEPPERDEHDVRIDPNDMEDTQ